MARHPINAPMLANDGTTAAIRFAVLANPTTVPLGVATTPDGLCALLSGDGCGLSRCRTDAHQTAADAQRRIFATRHERCATVAASPTSRTDRAGPATAPGTISRITNTGHFMVAAVPFCGAQPQWYRPTPSRNSRPGQGANVVVLVSTATVLQRHQHHARANCSTLFTPVLTETHHG